MPVEPGAIEYATEAVYHAPVSGAVWVDGVGWSQPIDDYATTAAASAAPYWRSPKAQPYPSPAPPELYGDTVQPPPEDIGSQEWIDWLENFKRSGGTFETPDGSVTFETPEQVAARKAKKDNGTMLIVAVAAVGALLLLRGR